MALQVAIAPLHGIRTARDHSGDFWTASENPTRPPHRSTTSAKAVKRSIVSPRAKQNGEFRALRQGVTPQSRLEYSSRGVSA